MTTLTKNETTVLAAFNTYADAAGTKSDLGVSWTDVATLASSTGLKVATVKGVVGSLVKKGLVQVDNDDPSKPDAMCLTEAGVDARFAKVKQVAPTVTNKTPAAVAKNAYKSRRAAAISIGKPVDANGNVVEPKASAKTPAKASAKTPAKASATFTSVDLAAEQGINAKTLRARIRRNIDIWKPLFVNGKQHTFADDAPTRKAVAALLAD